LKFLRTFWLFFKEAWGACSSHSYRASPATHLNPQPSRLVVDLSTQEVSKVELTLVVGYPSRQDAVPA